MREQSNCQEVFLVHHALNVAETPEAATIRYIIDAKGGKFTVQAFATGLLSVFGHNPNISIPDFEGEISLNPDALEKSSLRLLIHAASLTDTDDISEKDRTEITRKFSSPIPTPILFTSVRASPPVKPAKANIGSH